jgi:hypothetical protein
LDLRRLPRALVEAHDYRSPIGVPIPIVFLA